MEANVTQAVFSNESLRRVPRHSNYVALYRTISCFEDPAFENTAAETCELVKRRSCTDAIAMFDYLNFFICQMAFSKNVLDIMLVVLITNLAIFVYCINLFVVVRYFLVPNVLTLYKAMSLEQYNFGFMVLSLVLGIPPSLGHILECSSALNEGSILLSEYIGLMLGIYAIGFSILSTNVRYSLGGIRFIQSALTKLIGIFYVYEVLHFQYFSETAAKRETFNIQVHAVICLLIYGAYMLFILLQSFTKPKETDSELSFKRRMVDVGDSSSIMSDKNLTALNQIEYRHKPWKDVLTIFNPIVNMDNLPLYFAIICSVPYVIMSAFIPVLDEERAIYGWSKIIYCVSLFLFPLLLWLLKVEFYFILAAYIAVITVMVLVILLTHMKRQPQNLGLFSLWSIMVSVALTSVVNQELDALLWQVFNFYDQWEADIIKILFFSFSDFLTIGVVVVSLVRLGFSEIGYGFVVGLCLYLVYVPLSVTVLQPCYTANTSVGITANTETVFMFVILIMSCLTLGVAVCDFKLRTSHGVVVVLLYLIFLLFLFLGHQGVIHPYGTQHAVFIVYDRKVVQWA